MIRVMSYNILFLTLLISVVGSCVPSNVDQEVKASFTVASSDVEVNLPVHFVNTSEGVDQASFYQWNFGDGNTSNLKSPSHTYSQIKDGHFSVTVTLKVTSGSETSSYSKKLSLYYNNIQGRQGLTQKLSDEDILICAHRGYHDVHPENSLPSIEAAIEQSEIQMVELDVRETKDGHLVIIHDKTIDRTTNGAGNVSSFTLEELKTFKLYNKNGILTNYKIPTLSEVLEVCRGNIYIDLDISRKVAFEKVYPIVKRFGMLHQVLFYSNEQSVISSILGKDAKVLALPKISSEEDFNSYRNLNLSVVYYTNSAFNQNLVSKAKNNGWFIYRNAYVNTTQTPKDDNYNQIDNILNLKGNIIQTDYPVLVGQYIN